MYLGVPRSVYGVYLGCTGCTSGSVRVSLGASLLSTGPLSFLPVTRRRNSVGAFFSLFRRRAALLHRLLPQVGKESPSRGVSPSLSLGHNEAMTLFSFFGTQRGDDTFSLLYAPVHNEAMTPSPCSNVLVTTRR